MEEKHVTMKKSLLFIPKCVSPLIPIFLNSLKIIFFDYPKLFFAIYVTTALPLSILTTSLSISSTPRRLKVYMMHLEWLSRVAPTLQEAKNVWDTSQDELRKLYYFRALHALPILLFALVNVVATVTLTSLAYNKKYGGSIPTKNKCYYLSAVLAALIAKCIRPLLVCVINSFVWIVWGHVYSMLAIIVGYPGMVVAVVVEVYMMAVFSLSLVVSIEEEWAGLNLVYFGLGLMKGKRVCGWVISGLILLCVNIIGREMVGVVDGQDLNINGKYTNWRVGMRVGYMIVLVLLLGWIVLVSNVVFTVCYCDWRKTNVNNREALVKDLDCDIEFP